MDYSHFSRQVLNTLRNIPNRCSFKCSPVSCPCFSSAASISVFGHASGTHSQHELRMNHSHFFSACLWSARNGASGWAADIYSRNFSSVTDRSDPMQRDAYAHSTKYAVMNSSAVCLFGIKMRKIRLFWWFIIPWLTENCKSFDWRAFVRV